MVLSRRFPPICPPLAPYGGHVFGDVRCWGSRSGNWRNWRGFFGWNLACGDGHSPSGELVRVARTFALADQGSMMPQSGPLPSFEELIPVPLPPQHKSIYGKGETAETLLATHEREVRALTKRRRKTSQVRLSGSAPGALPERFLF